jgi:hypothetical protein
VYRRNTPDEYGSWQSATVVWVSDKRCRRDTRTHQTRQPSSLRFRRT